MIAPETYFGKHDLICFDLNPQVTKRANAKMYLCNNHISMQAKLNSSAQFLVLVINRAGAWSLWDEGS